MDLARRTMHGTLWGVGGTLALAALRKTLAWAGLVHATAPEQVVDRLEKVGVLKVPSPRPKCALAVVAHLDYGAGSGAALALLRRERGDAKTEAAPGSALGCSPGVSGGRAGSRSSGSTLRPGRSKPRGCCCRSWITRWSALPGGCCTAPHGT